MNDWISVKKKAPIEGTKIFACNKHATNIDELYICGWWYEDENCINTNRNCEGYKYGFTHWMEPNLPKE